MARFMHGGVVGGALEDPSISFVHVAATSGATVTLSGLNFGATAPGQNQKWGVVSLYYLQASASVSITSASICGETASVIYTTSLARGPSTLRSTRAVFSARIDNETTGDVVFTSNGSGTVRLMVARVINLDCSATTHTASGAGAPSGSITTSCNAGGGILAHGEYGAFSTPSTANHNNLTTLNHTAGVAGHALAQGVFASAQSGLNVGFVPNSWDFKTTIALSFAGI